MHILGWIGSLLFAICAIPQAWQSWRDGHSRGISSGFLLLWFSGEVLTLLYVASTLKAAPLILNYVANLTCLLIIIRYKIRPRY